MIPFKHWDRCVDGRHVRTLEFDRRRRVSQRLPVLYAHARHNVFHGLILAQCIKNYKNNITISINLIILYYDMMNSNNIIIA